MFLFSLFTRQPISHTNTARASPHSNSSPDDVSATPSALPALPSIILTCGRSKSESLAIQAFAEVIQENGGDPCLLQIGVRLPQIVNPETGRRLEFDSYYPPWKLAVEYNGAQHYSFPNHYHPDTPAGRAAFQAQLRRDQHKLKAARENGIRLIRIPYHVDTCCPCESNPTLFKYDRKITKPMRLERLRCYLRPLVRAW